MDQVEPCTKSNRNEGREEGSKLDTMAESRTMTEEDNLQNQKQVRQSKRLDTTWKDKRQPLVIPRCQDERLSPVRKEKWRKVLSPNRICNCYREWQEWMAPFRLTD